ncbi:MAG: hypothetical protein Q7S36_03525 [Candidatus Liptonbacteria bacterium]|nr:hypothetical protein [Candidatus Liptonbacteria bacterium]
MTPGLLREVKASYDRLTEEELANLGIVLGAYRSFRGNRRKHIAYVSMPITSGKRLYDVLSEEGVRTAAELAAKCGKDALWERVLRPNVAEGVAFADKLGKRENLLFISPSVFEAKKWRWTEDAYMSLWYRVIGEMAGRHVVMDDWEYSNGGVDEVLFSLMLHWRILRMSNCEENGRHFGLKNFLSGVPQEEKLRELQEMWKIRIFDAKRKEIRLDAALRKCVDAIYCLRERELPYDTLLRKAHKMMLVPWFTPDFYQSDVSRDSDSYREDGERIKALLPESKHPEN